MTAKDRHEQARRLSQSYRKASRKEKATILDAFCLSTGLNRKYAIGLLREPPEKPPAVKSRRRRKQRYGAEVIKVLETIWEAADFPWSVRLKAMISLWLPHLRKRMSVSAKTTDALLTISPRTIDRRLRDKRMATRRRLYGRTKPGTLLKHQIPIRTERWDVGEPGWGEIDLVSHSGACADGEFAHSMNFTDIHSTWVETRAILTKAQTGVIESLDSMRQSLPFRLCGIDSDNGSEFINHHVVRYCENHKIQFTRGRPYKKDDNAHIEQKNWTHVRRLVGWERIDSRTAVDLLNDLYCNEWRWMMNLFQPSVKLVGKQRTGSRLRRLYDAPATPLDRLLAEKGKTIRARLDQLVALRDDIDPFVLSNQIQAKIDRIHQLARRPGLKPVATNTLCSEGSLPLLDPPPQRGGGRRHPEVTHAQI
jgi:hypothetical protein